jgi:hypothetical protein
LAADVLSIQFLRIALHYIINSSFFPRFTADLTTVFRKARKLSDFDYRLQFRHLVDVFFFLLPGSRSKLVREEEPKDGFV